MCVSKAGLPLLLFSCFINNNKIKLLVCRCFLLFIMNSRSSSIILLFIFINRVKLTVQKPVARGPGRNPANVTDLESQDP